MRPKKLLEPTTQQRSSITASSLVSTLERIREEQDQMGHEDDGACEDPNPPKSAMALTHQEWDTLADIVTAFRRSGGYESPERKALINRIIDATA
jgi:hypothetical protein